MGVTDFFQSQGGAQELLLLVSPPLIWTILFLSRLKKSIWDYQSEEGRERGKVKKMKEKLGNLFLVSLVRGWNHKLCFGISWSCFRKATAVPGSSLLSVILFMQRVFKQEGQMWQDPPFHSPSTVTMWSQKELREKRLESEEWGGKLLQLKKSH